MNSFKIIILITFLTSCASILRGTKQTVTITSQPTGAEVLVDGISRGVTPLTIKLKKNSYDTIMVKKKGYNTQTRPLEKSYDSIALLNIFWDSSTTDMISGAAYEYEPSNYHFKLEKESNTTASL